MRLMRVFPVLGLLSAIVVPARAQQYIPQSALIAMVEVHKASILRYI